MEEYTRLLDKIPRLSQSSDSGGANDEEAAVIIDRYYDTKRNLADCRWRLADIDRRIRSIPQ